MSLLGSSRFYGSQLDDLYGRYPPDIVDVSFRSRMWGEAGQVGEFADEFGILWKKTNPDYVGQPVRGPLEDLRMLDTYVFPDAGANGRFDAAAIEDAIAGNPERFIRAYAGHLFEPLQWLRGTTNLLMDLYDEDRARLLEDLLERMTDYVVQTVRNWRPFRVDGIWFMDDWGSNRQLLIDPQKWRTFFKPRYRRIIREIHECGWPAEMHSDGYIFPIIPDLIELGLDVLNPQHNLMGNREVRELCFGKICIRSDIDCQMVLPFASAEEVRRHVREVVRDFKHPDGGLILHGEVEIGVPFENYRAMYEEFEREGSYG